MLDLASLVRGGRARAPHPYCGAPRRGARGPRERRRVRARAGARVRGSALSATDPVDLSFSSIDGDLELTDDLVFTSGSESVLQMLDERLGTIRSEWFLDEDEGLPLFETETISQREAILGAVFDESYVRNQATQIILSTPNVTLIESLSVTFDRYTSDCDISFQVATTFGLVTGTVEI